MFDIEFKIFNEEMGLAYRRQALTSADLAG